MSKFLLVELYDDLENIPSDLPGVPLKTTQDGVIIGIRSKIVGVYAVDDLGGISADTLLGIVGDVLLPEDQSYKTIKRGKR